MELTVFPLGRSVSVSSDIADLIGFIDQSGMPYHATALGTLVEGTLDQLMKIVEKTYELIRAKAPRAVILIRLDDYADRTDLLSTSVAHMSSSTSTIA